MTQYFNKQFIIRLGVLVGIVFLCFRIAVYNSISFWISYLDITTQKTWLAYNIVYVGVMAVGFLISLIGVSKAKRWGVRLLKVVSLIVFIDCWKTFLLMSFWSVVGIIAALGWILSISLFLICATKTIKREFQFKPGLFDRSPKWKTFDKVSGRVLWLLLGLLFVTYLTHYYYIYPKQKITYPVPSNITGWKSFDLLNHSFQSPQDLKIAYVTNIFSEPNDFRIASLVEDEESLRIVVNMIPYDLVAKMFQYQNSYEFNRRLMRMVRFIYNLPFLHVDEFRIDEIDVGDRFDGILQHFDLDSGRDLYYFLVSDKTNRDNSGSLGIMFDKKEPANENIVKQIIGSLKLANKPTKANEIYFNEALSMIENGQFTSAQASLVNALDQNWNNPEYHYQLALAFKMTDNKVGAKSSLEEVVKQNPDYKDAKQLLNEIKIQLEEESNEEMPK